MGMGGMDLEPPVAGVNMLLINTAGLALALVGLMLIYASANLKARIGIPFLNAVILLIFSGLLVYYMIAENISRILVALAVVDIVIAGAFLYFILQFKRTERIV
jgi:membrane-bound ClpP family serine protease